MISLVRLLREVDDSPKAIFMAGGAGSGKGYWRDELVPEDFTVINIDDVYTKELKDKGLGGKQQHFTPDQLSQSAKLMHKARVDTKAKREKAQSGLENMVIDGTAASPNPILKTKKELEDLGYKTFMIAIYTSPITSLKQNIGRDRQLQPSIVLRTWLGVNTNIDKYRKAFGENNFVLIDNDPKGAVKDYKEEDIKIFFDKAQAKGKPKTPEEQLKSKEKIEKQTIDIKQLLTVDKNYDKILAAKQKVDRFLR